MLRNGFSFYIIPSKPESTEKRFIKSNTCMGHYGTITKKTLLNHLTDLDLKLRTKLLEQICMIVEDETTV